MEILKIISSSQAINFILNNANLSELKTIEWDYPNYPEYYDKNIRATTTLLSVRRVKIHIYYSPRINITNCINEFIKLFPIVTELLIRSYQFNCSSVNYSSLTNLRRLSIDNYESDRSKNLTKNFNNFHSLLG